MQTLRWGILGTGTIATKFTQGLDAADGHHVAAVGSRTRESADRFGEAHGIPTRHGSYSDLAADPDVDAIYVSTPHTLHRENTLLCLEGGKAVLCEKPFALNAAQAREMVAAAKSSNLFLLEAMWTRFNPVMEHVRHLVGSGELGEIRQMVVDFGFRAEFDASGRLFDPALGGGALLDVGIYCTSLARMVFGRAPSEVTSTADLGSTGVDEQCAWTFRYDDGALAAMTAAVRTETPQEAIICGTRGTVRIPSFWCPDRLIHDGRETRFDIAGNGYHYQAVEVARCLGEGLTESPTLPLDETVEIMETLDRIRAPWGLRYPGE